MVLAAKGGYAQEALKNSMAGQAAEARRLNSESMPFTVKSGDFRLLATPSLSLDWNDNVGITQNSNQESDFILRPVLDLQASYPITQRNLLTIDVGVGYSHYFQHSELSRLFLRSGSQVAFDVFFGDFVINLHDRMNYTQDAALEPAVADTGEYGTFENVAGILGTWHLRDATLTLGYDHLNSLSIASTFSQTDHASEMVVSRVGMRVHPRLTTGVEGTTSITAYQEKLLNNNQGYSAGLYAEFRPGSYFSVMPRAGYNYYSFDQTSEVAPAENLSGWYADLTVAHQPTEVVSYRVSIGHEISLGIYSDATERTYARPSISWAIFKQFSLSTGLSYEHGEEKAGNLRNPSAGASGEAFDYLGGNISIGYSRLRRVSMSLNYRFTIRNSDGAGGDYIQNMVGLTITYHS
jgi:hypothetical protein